MGTYFSDRYYSNYHGPRIGSYTNYIIARHQCPHLMGTTFYEWCSYFKLQHIDQRLRLLALYKPLVL